jgi:transcriptional regulator with XRE-family HTH domain
MKPEHTEQSNGEFVRAARERLGLTQAEFGDRLGVDKRTVIRWEQGSVLKRRDRIAITLLLERPVASQRVT